MEFRAFNDKTPLTDKNGDKWSFAPDTHGTDPRWSHFSTVLKNGEKYKVPEGIYRGPFMWIDEDRQIYIVIGIRGLVHKKNMIDNKRHYICKIDPCAAKSNKREKGWGCYWSNWDQYPLAEKEFIRFAVHVNFLEIPTYDDL